MDRIHETSDDCLIYLWCFMNVKTCMTTIMYSHKEKAIALCKRLIRAKLSPGLVITLSSMVVVFTIIELNREV